MGSASAGSVLAATKGCGQTSWRGTMGKRQQQFVLHQRLGVGGAPAPTRRRRYRRPGRQLRFFVDKRSQRSTMQRLTVGLRQRWQVGSTRPAPADAARSGPLPRGWRNSPRAPAEGRPLSGRMIWRPAQPASRSVEAIHQSGWRHRGKGFEVELGGDIDAFHGLECENPCADRLDPGLDLSVPTRTARPFASAPDTVDPWSMRDAVALAKRTLCNWPRLAAAKARAGN